MERKIKLPVALYSYICLTLCIRKNVKSKTTQAFRTKDEVTNPEN